MNRRWAWILLVLWLGSLAGAGTHAQQPEPGEADLAAEEQLGDELRTAMERYFRSRLRAELGLTDEQMVELAPRLERIERSRSSARRERLSIVRRLQRGLRTGADDDQLQGLLDRLDSLEFEQRDLERSAMREIDATLTVRQRVELRFFVQRFRRELQRKVQQLRDDGRPPRRGEVFPRRPRNRAPGR